MYDIMVDADQSRNDKYLKIIVDQIEVCRNYRPAFGREQKHTLREFQQLYGSDPFYAWLGLNDPIVYAAHRAAGGITSIYRQIGLGCEQLFRQIVQDHLDLNSEQVRWSYQIPAANQLGRKLSLDARIQVIDIPSDERRAIVTEWLAEAGSHLQVAPEVIAVLKGAVFEVRQGYKSKDSKRQNADIANAATAYAQGYLPILLLLSTQIDHDVANRYTRANWLILQGSVGDSRLRSTYTFAKDVLDFDLAAFFQRNSATLRETIAGILEALLTTRGADD